MKRLVGLLGLMVIGTAAPTAEAAPLPPHETTVGLTAPAPATRRGSLGGPAAAKPAITGTGLRSKHAAH